METLPVAQFPTTRWTDFSELHREGPEAAAALERLCAAYWFPVYAYVRRRAGEPEIARDSTQAFFEFLLTKDTFLRVRSSGGRFRSFLLTSCQNFLRDQHKRETRQIRRPAAGWLDLDAASLERRYQTSLTSGDSPERDFDRHWALTVLDRAFSELEADYVARDRAELGRHLQRFLLKEENATSHAETAKIFGLSESAVKTELHRLRHRLRELLRDQVAATVGARCNIEEETRHLFAALSHPG